jgi:hypothetical protein
MPKKSTFYCFSPERKVSSRTYALDASLIPSLYSSYKAEFSSTERFLLVFLSSLDCLFFNEYHVYTLGSTTDTSMIECRALEPLLDEILSTIMRLIKPYLCARHPWAQPRHNRKVFRLVMSRMLSQPSTTARLPPRTHTSLAVSIFGLFLPRIALLMCPRRKLLCRCRCRWLHPTSRPHPQWATITLSDLGRGLVSPQLLWAVSGLEIRITVSKGSCCDRHHPARERLPSCLVRIMYAWSLGVLNITTYLFVFCFFLV